jgi:zinc D-Ala-D-Ala carboxypeptidase
MKLSKNFSVAELSKSEWAARNGVDNTPSLTVIDNLQQLVDNILQPVRDKFGPVVVTSAYRSPAVNKGIGGSATSDHTKGQAADFEVLGMHNKELAEWIRDNLKFTQLILEFPSKSDPNAGWVHCSYDKTDLKCEVLTAVKIGGRTGYNKGLNV